MKNPLIGIIGGAGPSAGSLLFDTIIAVAQTKYGCKEDREFPHILLTNYPFSDMLSEKIDDVIIRRELSSCFSMLERSGVTHASIACNTLHAFLPEIPPSIELVNMVEETKKEVSKTTPPFVLCSSTSARKELHRSAFSCEYANATLQKILDRMIAEITFGAPIAPISSELSALIPNKPVLLGCTEFSYLHERAPLRPGNIIDPNHIVAEKLTDRYFSKFLLHH